MSLKKRQLKKIGSSSINVETEKINNNRVYRLEGGKVNIYQNLKLECGEPSSLPTKEKIMAFDVTENGGKIITGGEDGIREWKLKPQPNLEEE